MEMIERENNSIQIIDVIGEVDLYNTKEIKDMIDEKSKQGNTRLSLIY